jgi:hypothetical protein
MKVWHVTTTKKVGRYRDTGAILPPVRFWRFEASARAWAKRVGRDRILALDVPHLYPLPDHKPNGHAAWFDGLVREWTDVTEASG